MQDVDGVGSWTQDFGNPNIFDRSPNLQPAVIFIWWAILALLSFLTFLRLMITYLEDKNSHQSFDGRLHKLGQFDRCYNDKVRRQQLFSAAEQHSLLD